VRPLFKAPREDDSWFRAELDCSENNQQFSPEQKMKTKRTITKTLWNSLLIIFLGTLLAGQAHGQIFVTNSTSNTVGEYDAATGATINSALVSGLNGPTGIAVSGGNLWVYNLFAGTIGEYNATTGATVNASLVSGLGNTYFMALSGGNLFVTDFRDSIGEYDATTGATINSALVSGLNAPAGIVVSGGNLWVANFFDGTIGEYDATTGATINSALVSGLNGPAGIAVSGGNLWVVNYASGTIGEYNATTGATVNASLVSGLSGPFGMALSGGNLFVTNSSANSIGEYDATTGATINSALVSGLNQPFGIAVAEPYTAQVQQPINPDGSSVFSVRRGVIPVKFTLTQDGVATCALPPATIALTRTAGATTGAIDESVYTGSADTGSNFRIDSCQYVYNLSTSALGVGTYRVDIMINGDVVGNAIFQLK
jgi:streptogramin lyase